MKKNLQLLLNQKIFEDAKNGDEDALFIINELNITEVNELNIIFNQDYFTKKIDKTDFYIVESKEMYQSEDFKKQITSRLKILNIKLEILHDKGIIILIDSILESITSYNKFIKEENIYLYRTGILQIFKENIGEELYVLLDEDKIILLINKFFE